MIRSASASAERSYWTAKFAKNAKEENAAPILAILASLAVES
jgi:hypothetical protein